MGDFVPRDLVNTQSAAISLSTSGTLVAAAGTGLKIKVPLYVLVAGTAGASVKFQSGTVDLTGTMSFAANGGAAVAGGMTGLALVTAANQPLVLNITGTATVGGHLTYFIEA